MLTGSYARCFFAVIGILMLLVMCIVSVYLTIASSALGRSATPDHVSKTNVPCGYSDAISGVTMSARCDDLESVTSQSAPPTTERPQVMVATNKLSYFANERIVVKIQNYLHEPILAPAPLGACSIVVVQRLKAGRWVDQGRCPKSTASRSIRIDPEGTLTSAIGPAASEVLVFGPTAGKPATSSEFQGKVSELPWPETSEPGDANWLVPRGDDDASLPAVVFSGLESRLGPGRYRVRFRFMTESDRNYIVTVYSETFVVSG